MTDKDLEEGLISVLNARDSKQYRQTILTQTRARLIADGAGQKSLRRHI